MGFLEERLPKCVICRRRIPQAVVFVGAEFQLHTGAKQKLSRDKLTHTHTLAPTLLTVALAALRAPRPDAVIAL